MNVIGHEYVGRAEEPLARGCMKQEFSKVRVKSLIEPTGGPELERDGPVHNRKRLIIFARQSRQMMHFGSVLAFQYPTAQIIGLEAYRDSTALFLPAVPNPFHTSYLDWRRSHEAPLHSQRL